MKYHTFKEEISRRIEQTVGEGTVVRFCRVSHVNTGEKECIVVCAPGETAAPAIPVKGYYDAYENGEKLCELTEQILRDRAEVQLQESFDCSRFTDREYVLSHLEPRLIGCRDNAALLEETPHRDFLNLAVVYYCMMDTGTDVRIGALVRLEYMKHLNLTLEEMEQAAHANMSRRHPAQICTLEHLLEELVTSYGGNCQLPVHASEPLLYVVTDLDRIHGAYWITDPLVRKTLADQIGDDYYILPSSMHECIVLPVGAGMQPRTLLEMVREINEQQVEREERLANAVFVYDRAKEEFTIAAE